MPCYRRAHLVWRQRFLGISITRSAHCALARWRMGSNGCLTAHILPSCFHLPHKTSLLSFRLTQSNLVRAGDAATYNRLYAGHRCGKDGAAILGCYASTGSFLGKAFLASRQTSDAFTVLQSNHLSTVLFDSGLVVCAAYSRTAKTLALSKHGDDCATRLFVAVYLRRGWRLSGQLLSGYVAAHLQTRAFST